MTSGSPLFGLENAGGYFAGETVAVLGPGPIGLMAIQLVKALGATRGLVARVFAVEYALLGAAAGLGGSALAAALAWGVLHWALDVRWGGSLVTLVWGVGASAALALGVGFLGTFRLLGRKPLAVLRSE